jgi:peptide/nickel transport system ATP-binding protein/oligopeptide transport system ATP-binding protein
MTSLDPNCLLRVEDLTRVFAQGGVTLPGWMRRAPAGVSLNPAVPAHVTAVDGISFDVAEGQAVGIVGESGCGKTTVARCLLRLIKPTSGAIIFDGKPVLRLSGSELSAFRRQAQIVFQDPFASLDPRFTVQRALAEPLRVHQICSGSQIPARAAELLNSVGLDDSFRSRYRHELSGGEAQRVTIARALATGPRFLILDEPTSALDASARLKVISLLRKLRHELGMTYLVISHDLSIIRYLCDRVLVMYLGHIVEDAPTDELFRRPQHPYTEALLSATPVARAQGRVTRIRLHGQIESAGPIEGCPLAPRCHRAAEECFTHPQRLEPIGPGHSTACHRVSEGQIVLPARDGLLHPRAQTAEERR